MFKKLKALFGFSGQVETQKPVKQVVVIPPVDAEMIRFMEIGALWPCESASEKVEYKALMDRGVHKRVDDYFKAKEVSGILMTDLSGLEFDYYWNG